MARARVGLLFAENVLNWQMNWARRVLVADLSSWGGCNEPAETALDGLDILVNNAGITRDNLAL